MVPASTRQHVMLLSSVGANQFISVEGAEGEMDSTNGSLSMGYLLLPGKSRARPARAKWRRLCAMMQDPRGRVVTLPSPREGIYTNADHAFYGHSFTVHGTRTRRLKMKFEVFPGFKRTDLFRLGLDPHYSRPCAAKTPATRANPQESLHRYTSQPLQTP